MTTIDIIDRAVMTLWVVSSALVAAGIDLGGLWQRLMPTWLRVVVAMPLAANVSWLIWTAP